MIRYERRGLAYYEFEGLASQGGLKHYVFSRQGGTSQPPFASLNVGGTVGDDEKAVAANHRLLYGLSGVSADQVVTAHQVHGRSVMPVGGVHRRLYPETDGLISDVPGLMLMMRFADCAPVMLYDGEKRAVGLVHAGRRGALAGIVREAVERMRATYGTSPSRLIAGIGPSIGPCCYQIGPEVIGEVRGEYPDAESVLLRQPDGTYHLDLWEMVRGQLASLGVGEIELAGVCTACNTDDFFSHRAENGKTGRFAALIGLT